MRLELQRNKGNFLSFISSILVTIFLFCLNLISFTGGLLLTKQWKRAFRYSLFLISIAVLNWIVERSVWKLFVSGELAYELPDWHFYGHAFFLLAVVSGVLKASFQVRKKYQSCGRGFVLSSCVATLLAIFLTYQQWDVASSTMLTYMRQGGIPLAPHDHEKASFHKDINLLEPTLWGDPTIPVFPGSSEIKGKVLFNGEPADVTAKLLLNSYWRTKTVRTDKNGEFTLVTHLTSPEINRLKFDWWFNSPSDSNQYVPILVSPVLEFDDAFFNEPSYHGRIKTDTETTRSEPNFIVNLVKYIDTEWPKSGEMNQPVNSLDQVISWNEVDSAAYYTLSFSKYNEDVTGAALSRRFKLKDAQVSISEIVIKARSPETDSSYYVDIAAFDNQNRLLSVSKSGFSKHSFTLKGYKIVDHN